MAHVLTEAQARIQEAKQWQPLFVLPLGHSRLSCRPDKYTNSGLRRLPPRLNLDQCHCHIPLALFWC